MLPNMESGAPGMSRTNKKTRTASEANALSRHPVLWMLIGGKLTASMTEKGECAAAVYQTFNQL